MLKPLRKCRHPGCSRLTAEGWCPEHKPKQQRKVSAVWHYLYTDPRYGWDTRRRRQLVAEPWCRECAAKGLRVPAADVAQVVPHRGSVEARDQLPAGPPAVRNKTTVRFPTPPPPSREFFSPRGVFRGGREAGGGMGTRDGGGLETGGVGE